MLHTTASRARACVYTQREAQCSGMPSSCGPAWSEAVVRYNIVHHSIIYIIVARRCAATTEMCVIHWTMERTTDGGCVCVLLTLGARALCIQLKIVHISPIRSTNSVASTNDAKILTKIVDPNGCAKCWMCDDIVMPIHTAKKLAISTKRKSTNMNRH